MAGFCTNLDLFVKLRSGGDLKNFMFLYESIISGLNTEVCEEDKNLIKEFCRLFCVNLNKKWIDSSRNQKTFMNRESTRKWLEKNINWPVCDSVDLRSEMGFSDAVLSEPADMDSHVPNLAVCTAEAGTSTEKEHRKPFEELGNKQKKRRSTSIVEENSEDELQHWYLTKLKDNGKTNLAKVIQYLSSNPEALSEVHERLFNKQSLSNVSADKCLALYTSLALSKWKYLALRQFLKEENCAAFPSYPTLVNAKKRCYPQQESMEITEKGAQIKLQALLDHTVERILLDVNSVDRSQNEELKLTWKWGLDGSSSQSNYKQKTSNTAATEFDDSSVVMISIVPLRLVSTSPSSGNENIVWENPTPCSTLYCRPVKFTFTSETADFIKSEESEMKKQIDERISTRCGNIIVSHELHMTMIDGKVANIIAEVPSYATCPICLAKPSEMNNLDALTSKPLREEIYKHGISSLHMKIRCMECILHISYNLDFQRWTARSEHKALKQAKKNTTQQEFREQTGMLIDIVKQVCI